MDGLLDLAGDRIGGDQLALKALARTKRATDPALALHARLVRIHDGLAVRQGGNVDHFCLGTVRGRPEVVAAQCRGTNLLGWFTRGKVCNPRIGLNIFGRVVIDWLAGLLVDAFGPVDVVKIRLSANDLAVVPVHCVEKAVPRRMGKNLARLARDYGI